MNKKVIIILISFLLITTVTFTVIGCTNKNKHKDDNPSNSPNNSNNHNNTDENNNDSKINLFNKKLNSLEEIEETDIQTYLNLVSKLFNGQSYTEFSDEDINVMIAHQLLTNGESVPNEKIQQYVRELFGRRNYILKAGKYTSPSGEKITIIKNNNNFISDVLGRGLSGPMNTYKSMEVIDNQIIVHYDYIEIINLGMSESYNLIGKTDIYLRYIDGNLILEKIIYT